MFKHLLMNMLREYRDIETGGEEPTPGGEASAETAEVETETAQSAETQHGDGYPEGTPDWIKRRMSQMTQQKREAQRQNEELQKRLEALEQQRTQATPEQIANFEPDQLQQYVEALANQRAQEIAQQTTQQSAKQQKWNGIEEAGNTTYGEEFFNAAKRLQESGATNQHFVDALEEIDEAADVLAYLGQHQNLEEAARIASLSPVKMAVELARLGPKARTELKKTRVASKAPAPLAPVGGNTPGGKIGKEPPTGSADWFAWRNQQVAERRGR